MRKMITIFWYFILISKISYAQERKIITNDSLLKMFQVMKPFEVLNKVGFGNMNFKAFYYDLLLKPYLMKWLDKDEYFQFEIEKERATMTNSPRLIKEEIQYMLNKQGRRNALDSILNNPILYSQYRDSAINNEVKRFFENHKEKKFNIPGKAITLHSYFAYPESYTIIKQWWVESGRKTERSDYFLPLVRMGDPDARKEYDNRVTQFVKTNGEIPGIMYMDEELHELRNSYSVAKMIEVLKVDMVYDPLEDNPQPYNCYVIKYLLGDILDHCIEIKVKTSDPCDVQKKHLPEIKAAAQKLIEKYKAEEYYWMKNMPFYKGEGTGN